MGRRENVVLMKVKNINDQSIKMGHFKEHVLQVLKVINRYASVHGLFVRAAWSLTNRLRGASTGG